MRGRVGPVWGWTPWGSMSGHRPSEAIKCSVFTHLGEHGGVEATTCHARAVVHVVRICTACSSSSGSGRAYICAYVHASARHHSVSQAPLSQAQRGEWADQWKALHQWLLRPSPTVSPHYPYLPFPPHTHTHTHNAFHSSSQATQPSISPSVLRNTKPPLGPGYLDVAATA